MSCYLIRVYPGLVGSTDDPLGPPTNTAILDSNCGRYVLGVQHVRHSKMTSLIQDIATDKSEIMIRVRPILDNVM